MRPAAVAPASALRPFPSWAGFVELRGSASGDPEPLLTAILPSPHGDPFGVH